MHAAPMDLEAAVRNAHRDLSEHSLELLEHALSEPAFLRRETFSALDRPSGFVSYPLQSWPAFVRAGLLRELEAANEGVCRLIKSLPERAFGLDPDRLAGFYRLDGTYAALLAGLFRDRRYLDALVARGDFVRTARGFLCLEMNMTGNLGGWRAPLWERLYAQVPRIARFVAERSIRYRHRHTVRELFRHVIDCARRRGNLDGELNVAFLVAPDNRSHRDVERYGGEELRRCLAEEGIDRGAAMVCRASDLRSEGVELLLGARRVHALFEQEERPPDRGVFRALMAGAADVFNGPAAALLADKRNLALLSELVDSDLLDRRERDLVAAHVPWTRAVVPGPVVFEGREVNIEKLLLAERQRLVLKPAGSAHGVGVTVGRVASPDEWRRAAAEALAARGGPWVVQEHAESLPYLFQEGAEGCREHDLVWGVFVFGRKPGGGFLRMLPKGGPGVVNAARGASEGVVLEVDR